MQKMGRYRCGCTSYICFTVRALRVCTVPLLFCKTYLVSGRSQDKDLSQPHQRGLQAHTDGAGELPASVAWAGLQHSRRCWDRSTADGAELVRCSIPGHKPTPSKLASACIVSAVHLYKWGAESCLLGSKPGELYPGKSFTAALPAMPGFHAWY